MIDTLINESLDGGVHIVTTNSAFFRGYSGRFEDIYFIKALPVSKAKDVDFAKLAMPGELGAATFPDTDLEIWKVLSLDRYKFWYMPEFEFVTEFVSGTDWDVVYASSDLGSTLPIMTGYEAELLGRKAIWVKTEPIRTRELRDIMMAGQFPFNEFLVDSEDDKRFILDYLPDATIHMEEDTTERNPISQESKEVLKKMLGLSGNVLCILFDKRDEFQCREFLNDKSLRSGYNYVFLHPIDLRSRALLHTSIPDAGSLLLPDDNALKIADTILAFRWDDNYFPDGPPTKMQIIDLRSMNKAKQLAPKDISIK